MKTVQYTETDIGTETCQHCGKDKHIYYTYKDFLDYELLSVCSDCHDMIRRAWGKDIKLEYVEDQDWF